MISRTEMRINSLNICKHKLLFAGFGMEINLHSFMPPSHLPTETTYASLDGPAVVEDENLEGNIFIN
jgi:hypothetical protein